MAASQQNYAHDWQSSAVPPTIRRPWRVFEEDLEDKLADASSQGGEVVASVRERLASVQAKGAQAAFMGLPEDQQRGYAEVSMLELSAYVCWRQSQAARQNSDAPPATEFEAAWDILDCDDKAEWVPEDPRAVLAADGQWAPLLADGPPLCAEGGGAVGGSGQQTQQPTPAAAAPRVPLKAEPVPVALSVAAAATAAAAVKSNSAPLKQEREQHHGPKDDGSEGLAEEALRLVRGRDAADKSAEASIVAASLAGARPVRSCRAAPAPAAPAPSSRRGAGARRQVASRQVNRGQEEPEAEEEQGEEIEDVPNPGGGGGAVPTRRGGVAKKLVLKGPMAAECLCPEALDANCCTCGTGEATDDNDLGLCDRCDRAFHQRCHNPPIAHFGHPEDQWFCADCTLELGKLRKLSLQVGDFAWVQGPGDTSSWPARVLRIDFVSLADPKPYWVQYFDTGAPSGIWAGAAHATDWEDGPAFSSIREARRRNAVRLAEGAGAPPISAAAGITQPPVRTRAAPQRHSAEEGPPRRKRPVAEEEPPPKRRSARRVVEQAESEDEEETSKVTQQVDEMRSLIAAAKERQRRLEQELDEEAEKIAAKKSPLDSCAVVAEKDDANPEPGLAKDNANPEPGLAKDKANSEPGLAKAAADEEMNAEPGLARDADEGEMLAVQ
ncbi:unnamed protein product [Polarella glacialis]|nr:unnamed protein product [Polarella glacialis]